MDTKKFTPPAAFIRILDQASQRTGQNLDWRAAYLNARLMTQHERTAALVLLDRYVMGWPGIGEELHRWARATRGDTEYANYRECYELPGKRAYRACIREWREAHRARRRESRIAAGYER